MRSLSKPVVRRTLLCLLALLSAAPASAQVGAPPTAPTTLWNFLGIPYGIRKLQGATRNRRGNHPNREPKPPLKAIADPRNLESKDPSIKKAAEIKQAEDLKKQKIKAVKYLASIGCGCYDIDGGVTAALVASMSDCTEEVRYETIKAITEAAQEGCCANCGSTCCCNKDILTAFAKIAYERDEHGCYIEPSERVREAAAEGLRACCPNDSPPVIVAPQAEPEVERETAEEIEEGDLRETAPDGTEPTPPTPPVAEPLPAGGATTYQPPVAPQQQSIGPAEAARPAGDPNRPFGFGVIVDVSAEHSLAHVHFDDSNVPATVGAEIGVYKQLGSERKLIAVLQVVEAFPASANVTGTAEALAAVARGDMVLRRLAPAASVEAVASMAPESAQAVIASSERFVAPAEPAEPMAMIESLPPVDDTAPIAFQESVPVTAPVATATQTPAPTTIAAPTPAPVRTARRGSTPTHAASAPVVPAATVGVVQASQVRPLVAPPQRRAVRVAPPRRQMSAVFMP